MGEVGLPGASGGCCIQLSVVGCGRGILVEGAVLCIC